MFETSDYAQLIVLTGQKGVGKTTAASIMSAILSEIGYTVTITGLGSPIKKELMQAHGWKGIKTDYWRGQMLDIWKKNIEQFGFMCYVEQFEQLWKESITSDFIIITDCRREQDAAWMRDNGAWVVHLRNKNAEVDTEEDSEQLLSMHTGDVMIANDGDMRLLKCNCEQFIMAFVGD